MKQYTLVMYAGSMPKTPLYFRRFDSEGFAMTNRDKELAKVDSFENIISVLSRLNDSDKEAFGKLEISLSEDKPISQQLKEIWEDKHNKF